MSDKPKVDISFFQGKAVTCPICQSSFKREILRSGRGRLIAGDLMTDLRRKYKSTPKYGLINPLIYNVVVCPNCWYAAFAEDFNRVKPALVEGLQDSEGIRKKYGEMSYGYVDFEEKRTVIGGALSYLLALSSYSHLGKEVAPTTKKAICAIRSSWFCQDLHKEYPDENYEKMYEYFRTLAYDLYDKAILTSTDGSEDFAAVKHYGPDSDTNYGYEGVLYMNCLLGIEQSFYWDEEKIYNKYKSFRTVLAKVFGFGKSSKSKPGPLLDTAKELHEVLGKTINRLKDKYETDTRSKYFNK